MTPPITAQNALVQPTENVLMTEGHLEQAAPRESSTHVRRDFTKLLRMYVVTDILAIVLGFSIALGVAALVNLQVMGRDAMLPLGAFDSTRLIGLLVTATCVMLWFQHKGYYHIRMNFWA